MDWNDPSYKEKPKKEKPIEKKKEPLKCYTCGLFISLKLEPHCKCGIWDYKAISE